MAEKAEKPTSVKFLKAKFSETGLAPRKSLGQNFLIDENILQKIVNSGAVTKEDVVLEVGPGMGALTTVLSNQAGWVIAIEYDRGLFGLLQKALATAANIKLINEDIMKTDLTAILGEHNQQGRCCKVIANLPYYITTPVIFKLLESEITWERLIFLVQKEVADRMNARPGGKEYGALTVMLNFYGRVERIGVVPRTVFYPAPQVDSAIIGIFPHQDNWDKSLYPFLRKVVQAAFEQRRKMILNALATFESLFGSKKDLADGLLELGIDPERRGETLSVAEFVKLAQEICLRESENHRGC